MERVCPRCKTSEYVMKEGQAYFCAKPTPGELLPKCYYHFDNKRARIKQKYCLACSAPIERGKSYCEDCIVGKRKEWYAAYRSRKLAAKPGR